MNQTKQWIAEALVFLLEHKRFSEITITEIAIKAKIGRKTFYRHFESKEEVLDYYCESILKEFAESLMKQKEVSLKTVLLAYFEFWQRHMQFLELLHKAGLLGYIGKQMEEYAYHIALNISHVSKEAEIEIEVRYEFYYKIAGLWRLTEAWSERADRPCAADMALMAERIMSL